MDNLNKPALGFEFAAAVFELLFNDPSSSHSRATSLCTHGAEPLYIPWQSKTLQIAPAFIITRSDYCASVLHEVSHWCIAGLKRRCLVDFGYWYEPEGRSPHAQQAFYAAERIPQSIECLLSQAAGIKYKPSYDDFSESNSASNARADFARSVQRQVTDYSSGLAALPARASLYLRALVQARHFFHADHIAHPKRVIRKDSLSIRGEALNRYTFAIPLAEKQSFLRTLAAGDSSIVSIESPTG